MQLAQDLCYCLVFGNVSMALFQKVLGRDHLALLDHAPAIELGQHIYVLTLSPWSKVSTSAATVTQMLGESQVC